jgi:hypothetical protein
MTGERGRGWSEQDSKDRNVRTGKPEHEKHGQGSWDCMTKVGQPRQESQYGTARTGHPGQENQDRSVWTGQPDRSPLDRTGRAGQL